MKRQLLFDATISVKGIDRIGMLNEVTKVISDQFDVNIHKLTIRAMKASLPESSNCLSTTAAMWRLW